jgi:hypothetical protein
MFSLSYFSAPSAPSAVNPLMSSFLPSKHGFPFPNCWPVGMPVLELPTPFGRIPVGSAGAGVCGGMVFAAIDLFSYRLPVPTEPTPIVFRYLVHRLFDSWNLPFGGLRYYTWQARSKLTRLTIEEEWPKVRAVLDSGHPAPLGIVYVRSRDPREIWRNHQVLAYGYDMNGEAVSLRVYDPNYPGDDELTLTFETSNVGEERPVVHGIEGPRVRGFFLTEYRKASFRHVHEHLQRFLLFE